MLPYVACCISRIELQGPILFVAVLLEMPSAPHGAVPSLEVPTDRPVQAIPAWWALSAIEFGLLSMGSPKWHQTILRNQSKHDQTIYIYIKLM